jgi:hypothetical protein
VLKLAELADESQNPGLKFTNIRHKGFVAVKVTATNHVAEFFGFSPETIVTPYDEAISKNIGGLTAPFFCNVQMTTTAGSRGSLERSDNCTVIQFDASRPSAWSIPFPNATSLPSTKLSDCGYYQCKFMF